VFFEPAVQSAHLDIDQRWHLVARYPIERIDMIYPVHKFRWETVQEAGHHDILRAFAPGFAGVFHPLPQGAAIFIQSHQLPCPEIRGHEHKRIAERIGAFTRGNCQKPVIEDIHEGEHNLIARLFQFVKEHEPGQVTCALDFLLVENGGPFL